MHSYACQHVLLATCPGCSTTGCSWLSLSVLVSPQIDTCLSMTPTTHGYVLEHDSGQMWAHKNWQLYIPDKTYLHPLPS